MTTQVAPISKHFTQWMQEGLHMHYPNQGIQQTRSLRLANGVSLSIQASSTHYCSPRKVVPYSQYTQFEIGFPSHRIEALMPYCEDEDQPTKTVYAYVPLTVLDAYIGSVGGVSGYDD